MRVLVVAAMPGLMFASLGRVELHETCQHSYYSSGLLGLLNVWPECPAWPEWQVVMWAVAAALLATAVFAIRSASRPGPQATR
jgi:hypothetical protein